MNNQSAIPFALLLPGQPLITSFTQTNGIWHIDLPNPSTISNIGVVLTSPLPPNIAITLHYSLPPYNTMEYLGAVANQKPTDIYPTGFPFKPDLLQTNTVKFCLKGQTYQEIASLVPTSDGQKQYAKLVAHNLYNFMMSYHHEDMILNNPQGRQFLVIPAEVFTKWVNKFDEKYAKDPNFIAKTTQD